MKLPTIIFIFFCFAMFKLQFINSENSVPDIALPTLEVPDFEFVDLSAGCGGFTDCIEYVGAVIYNIGLGIIFIVLLLVNLIVYIFKFLTLLAAVTITGIEGAPTWVNALIILPLIVPAGIIVYKMIRKGDTDA